MRSFLRNALVLAAAGLTFGVAPLAQAAVPPTLQVSATGSGDDVAVVVHGDPNLSVLFSYNKAGLGPTIASLGTTDANGNFSETISSASYGLTSGTLVTALLGGTGGLKSPTVSWPAVTSANSLTLSSYALVTTVGATASITATNLGGGSLYLSSNSNPAIANVSVSGSSISVYGLSVGATNATLCLVGTSGSCPVLSIRVLQSGSGTLSFSTTNPTVVAGQNLPVTISGGSGTYAIQSNSDANVIQSSLSGSVLTLSTGVKSGSASFLVCSTDYGACGALTATAGDASSAPVSVSSSAPTLAAGASAQVYVYGPSGATYYVSSNSNPSKVQANLSGTTLTLTGIAEGTSSVEICSSTNACVSLTATITGSAAVADLALSQHTLSLDVGQSAVVTISGGNQPYSTTGGSSVIESTSINGTALTVFGLGAGSTTVWVCEHVGGACSGLLVNVNGTNTSVPATTATTPSTPVVNTPSTRAVSAVTFTDYLAPGAEGAQVTALQKLLIAQGFSIKAGATGYYGAQTVDAVVAFQKAHGIAQLGVVGPSTRSALNALSGTTLAELQAQLQALEAEIAQVKNKIAALSGS